MALPILYSFRRCPYAMRARLALAISGILCEIREIRLAHKPQAMLDISPKGTVPVLHLPDGQVLEQSLDVMQWALSQHDPEDWLDIDIAECSALIGENDGAFKFHLDRYKYPTRYEDCDPDVHFDAAAEIATALDHRIAKHGNLLRKQRSIADIALFPFVRQFAMTEPYAFEALPLPALQLWLEIHTESGLFAIVMEKYDPWQEGDLPILFPPVSTSS